MYFIYSILLSVVFLLMLPLFLLRREKYASGFRQRLGNYPEFKHDGRPVIWLHCVSVGETNAARPLVDKLVKEFPDHRLVVSTTTKTGHELAQKVFADKAVAVFYFPFDWKFSVRKALDNYKPSTVLLMETEIWPRFIYEAKKAGAKIAIVNGRLSEKSFKNYSRVRSFISRVLENVDLALMQGEKDAERIVSLGIANDKVATTGNLKFDVELTDSDMELAEALRQRFGIDGKLPMIVVASSHDPEERWILDALDGEPGQSCRLLIAPRHPERFQTVADHLRNKTDYHWAKRSSTPFDTDRSAAVILLDSIGELRDVFPLADIVFVGGSLIPHGGQSILEPAAAGRAIITGHHTHNFADIVREFLEQNALIQFDDLPLWEIEKEIFRVINDLIKDADRRNDLGTKAASVMKANRGATAKTIEHLKKLIAES